MKNFFFLIVGLIAIGGSVYLFLQSPAPPAKTVPIEQPGGKLGSDTLIYMGNETIYAQVADTPEERQQGLSGQEELLAGRGLLFIFDEVGTHRIWMKDMKFSIDILWLDEDKRIVWIEKDVSPDTFPQAFSSEDPARYVLELPAGAANEYSAQIGDILNFKT